MARKLPWLAPDGTEKPSKSSTISRSKRKQSEDDDDTDLSISKPSRKAKGKQRVRNPSSSPPPTTPEEEPMIDGLENDDGWVMVEDEFLTTAKLYTAHLHHADYQRLKKLSRVRAVSTMTGIERPTDGKTKQSLLTKKMIQASALRKSTQAAITNLGLQAEINEDDEDDPYMQDPQLAGLMNQHQPKGLVKVNNVVRSSQDKPKPTFKRPKIVDPTPESETEETDDGDLDLDCLLKATSRPVSKALPIASSRSSVSKNDEYHRVGSSYDKIIAPKPDDRRRPISKTSSRAPNQSESVSIFIDDGRPDPAKKRPLTPKFMQMRNKRLEEAKAAKEEDKKPSLSDISDVPMFLF